MSLTARSGVSEIVVDPEDLELSASEEYYRDERYPRPAWQRRVRSTVLQAFAFALSVVGLLAGILRALATIASSDPNIFRTLGQLWAESPTVVALAGLIFLLASGLLLWGLIWLHHWLRDDEERERRALARAKTGSQLARHYRSYLQRMNDLGPVAPILTSFTAMDVSAANTLFVGLQLRQVMLSHVGGRVLDPRDTSSDGARLPKSASDSPSGGAQERLAEHSATARVVDNVREAIDKSVGGAIVLLGDQGTGKTTLLHQLARNCAESVLQRSQPGGPIPIYFSLSDPQVAGSAISDVVEGIVRSALGTTVPADIAKRIRREILCGPSLFIIDGFDEVAGDARGKAVRHLNELRHTPLCPPPPKSPDSLSNGSADTSSVPDSSDTNAGESVRAPLQLVVASRFTGYRVGDLDPALFETWEVLPLTRPEAQKALVTNLLTVLPASSVDKALHSSDAPQLLAELNANSETAGWVRNPLLLTLATLVWWSKSGQSVAQTRTQLYRQAIDALMFQRMRGWEDVERIAALSLAQQVALDMFLRDDRAISLQDFLESIQPQLPSALGIRGPWQRLRLTPSSVLFDQSSLFVLRADGRYDIFHLTFLEYLAAETLARQLDRQWTQQVGQTTLLDAVRSYQGKDDHSPAEMSIRTNVLRFMWERHRIPRWRLVLAFMTGILSESAVTTPGVVGRPDLAASWVWALLRLPNDVGLVRLQLAASCVGAFDGTDDHFRNIARATAQLLTGELMICDRTNQQDRLEELASACGEQAESAIGREQICGALASLLQDDKWRMRRVGALAAGKLGLNGAAVVNNLLDLMADPSPEVRNAVAVALGQLGTLLPNLPRLLQERLKAEDWRVKAAAARAVGVLGEAGASALLDLEVLLRDASWKVHWAAISAIGQIGSTGADVLRLLLVQLGDEDDSIRTEAETAIRAVAGGGRLSETEQIKLAKALSSNTILRSPVGGVRARSLLALAALKGAAASLFPGVLEFLDDPMVRVREAAKEVIQSLTASDVPVYQELLEYISDSRRSHAGHIAAAETMAACSADEVSVESVLPILFEDGRWQIRLNAADAAKRTGARASSLVPHLERLLNDDENAEVRAAAGAALIIVDAPGHAPLSQIAGSILARPDQQVRHAALRIIRSLEDACRDGIPILRQIFVGHGTSPEIRGEAAWSILAAGNGAEEAIFDLIPGCDDPHVVVRLAALQVVARVIVARAPLPDQIVESNAGAQVTVRLDGLKAAERLGNDCMGMLPLVEKAVLRSGEDGEALDGVAAAAALHDILGPVVRLLDLLEKSALPADSPSFPKVTEVASLLQNVRNRAIHSWRALIDSRSPRVRQLAVDVAETFGTGVVTVQDDFDRLLTDREHDVGERAADVLGALGVAGAPVLQHLQELLAEDSHWYVRARVVRALGGLGTVEENMFLRLEEVFQNDPDLSVHLETVRALSQIESVTAHVSDAILAKFRDNDELVRMYALAGINAPGADDQATLSALRQCLDFPNIQVQLAAAAAAVRIKADPELVLSTLRACLADVDVIVRQSALQLLGSLGHAASEAMEDVRNALFDDVASIREAAANAILDIRNIDDSTRDALLEALADPDPDVCESAARTLGVLAPEALRAKLADVRSAILYERGRGLFLPFAQRRELDLYLEAAKAEQEVPSHVLELLRAEHWSVRQRALWVLSWSHHPSQTVLQEIARLREVDVSHTIRQTADEVLDVLLTEEAIARETARTNKMS